MVVQRNKQKLDKKNRHFEKRRFFNTGGSPDLTHMNGQDACGVLTYRLQGDTKATNKEEGNFNC
jgi:hypothetical protein